MRASRQCRKPAPIFSLHVQKWAAQHKVRDFEASLMCRQYEQHGSKIYVLNKWDAFGGQRHV